MSKTVQARIPDELKAAADVLFAEMGLTTSEAIRLFLKQSVNLGALPFTPVAKRPNAESIAAMRELESTEDLPRYENFAALRAEMDL